MNMPELVPAKHAIVTDECRRNRGGREAVEEALARLRSEAVQLLISWPTCGVKFHFILAVERPGSVWVGTPLYRSDPPAPAETICPKPPPTPEAE